MQLTELQLYIINISRCLVIVDIICTRIQDNQWNTIIQCETLFTSQLFTNYNNFQKDYNIQIKKQHYTIPKHIYSSFCIPQKTQYPDPARTLLHLRNHPQILLHHHHLCQNINLANKIMYMFPWSDQIFEKNTKYIFKNMKNWSSW